MFTGLIETVGCVTSVESGDNSARLEIVAPGLLKDGLLVAGESIAVDGVCLTVEQPTAQGFTAFVSDETLQCTTLKFVQAQAVVNLERALRVGDRLGGHMVSGHVDAVGALISLKQEGQGWWLQVGAGTEILGVSVAKGSIAVDGISLTIVDLTDNYFTVAVIPTTYNETTLGKKRVGDPINLESDIVGKHIWRAMQAYQLNDKSGDSVKKAAASVFDLASENRGG